MAFVGEREGVLSPTDARAERLLVALTPSWDLFVHARNLFVEAMPLTWLHTQHSGAGGIAHGSSSPCRQRAAVVSEGLGLGHVVHDFILQR
jgi:hypothetical protein